MQYFTLDLYQTFSCLAGECPSTCCAGWKILVDAKDYERFTQLPDKELRQDILSNIQRQEDAYYFRNREEGRCAMLDADGLCRIQRNTDEKTLCNTCRKYPRIINSRQGNLYLSMAASCPVVANYIVSGKVVWEHSVEIGSKRKVYAKNISIVQDVFDDFISRNKVLYEYSAGKVEVSLLLSGMEKIVSQVLDLILAFREGMYLIPVFQILEQEIERDNQLKCFGEFVEKYRKIWGKIRSNYIEYRFLSRRMEFMSESISECILQTEAELLLIRAMAFCYYVADGKVSGKRWSECIQMAYRFCVHGKKVAEAFHCAILSFFSNEDVWSYLLV